MRASIGRYRILEKLGEGGMGAVFAAQDEQLARKVAIKTIHPEIVDATARARLWREARAAAAVNHPGVCQVYEVGEDGKDLFLAMELLEGEALSDRMERGALPLGEAIQIAVEVLEALSALHAQGFVHRDLKPSNVFCTPHGIKLLDFGVVLPVEDAFKDTDQRLTSTGMMIGTPAFMAPEQWTGSDVSPASDLFSVGGLLFEMVSGEPTFQGKNALELYNAITREPTPTLMGGPAIESLDRVVQRALARDPADRPESASAMAAELRKVVPLVSEGEAVSSQRLRRLLVVPFRMLRPDEEIDFLPAGLADALVSSLATRDGLIVKPGGSTWADEAPDYSAMARETGVQLALAGTLLRHKDRIRVTAQVVELPDGDVVWSEQRQAALDDLFTLQDELAADIAQSLSQRLEFRDTSAPRPDVPATAKAYEYFMRANQMALNFGLLPAARDLYLAALAEDPRFAPAWARLGRVYRVMAKYGHGQGDEIDNAEEAFRKALELNPTLPIAHALFAYFEIEELGDPHGAMARLLDQARSAPTNAELLSGLVVACRFCGLLDASLEADRRARRLDPAVRTSLAYTLWMLGEYEAAIAADDEDMRWSHQHALPMLGREDEAIAVCREVASRTGRQTERDMVFARVGALQGDRDTTVPAARRVFASSFHDPEGLYLIARDVARVGEAGLALEILESVVGKGFSCADTIARDPWLEPLRADGRLDAIVAAAREGHERAKVVYAEHGGPALLGPV